MLVWVLFYLVFERKVLMGTYQKSFVTEFEFFPSDSLPKEIPISTPLTFAFMGQDLVLTKKKNGWWDILGGKVRNGESWQNALKREAYEEAGVAIDDINVIGYVKAVILGKQGI